MKGVFWCTWLGMKGKKIKMQRQSRTPELGSFKWVQAVADGTQGQKNSKMMKAALSETNRKVFTQRLIDAKKWELKNLLKECNKFNVKQKQSGSKNCIKSIKTRNGCRFFIKNLNEKN